MLILVGLLFFAIAAGQSQGFHDRVFFVGVERLAGGTRQTLGAPWMIDGVRPDESDALLDYLQALIAATPESTTVSIEALNWGFGHFGEFARAYRECFGELPSETLRRRPAGAASPFDPGNTPVIVVPTGRKPPAKIATPIAMVENEIVTSPTRPSSASTPSRTRATGSPPPFTTTVGFTNSSVSPRA